MFVARRTAGEKRTIVFAKAQLGIVRLPRFGGAIPVMARDYFKRSRVFTLNQVLIAYNEAGGQILFVTECCLFITGGAPKSNTIDYATARFTFSVALSELYRTSTASATGEICKTQVSPVRSNTSRAMLEGFTSFS